MFFLKAELINSSDSQSEYQGKAGCPAEADTKDYIKELTENVCDYV